MKLANVLYKLFVDPWCITPGAHQNLCAIVHDHFTGDAHLQGGRVQSWDEEEPEDESEPILKIEGNIGIVSVNGVLGRRVGSMEKSSGVTDVLDIEQAIGEARTKNLSGLLFSFDSPGGAVSGIPELGKLIAAEARRIPIVAYADDLMASAAYWLGSQAHLIVANESSQVGSIGVYQAFLDESRNYDLEGFKVDLFATGKFKGMGIRGLPLSPEQKTYLQSRVDQVFGWFKEAVAAGRGTIPDDAMQGQTFYGADAVKLNLVDRIGNIAEAKEELNALIG